MQTIKDVADYQTFSPGDLILKCPTPHPKVGYISRGRVAVTYKDADRLEPWAASHLPEGSWIGAETYDCQCPKQASINWVASETSLIGFLSLEQVTSLGLWPDLMKSLGSQKHRLLRMASRTQVDGKTRVQMLLDEKVQTEGEPKDGGVFVPVLDRTALAKAAGVGREYVSRLLTDMRLQGRIEPRGRGILFRTLEQINE